MSIGKTYHLTGGCLCGGVRYRIDGPCRDVIVCHCENCRRTHGHQAAYLSTDKTSVTMESENTLSWFHDQGPDTWRGFCNQCGSSLFWDIGRSSNRLSVAAGTLDHSDGLTTIGHIFMSEAGSYYQVNDELPRFERGSGGKLENE